MSIVPPVPPHDALPLAGRLVVVTGGAQGIGRGIAQAVLSQGGSVAILDRDGEAARACIAEWDAGSRASALVVDVTREAAVTRALQRLLERHGALHGLVNNAGIADPHHGPLDHLSLAEWRRRIDSHLISAFLCTRAALPALRAARGTIVNIASTRAHQSEPHTEAYAAAKGALLAFTHALAVSEGPRVRVNCVSPGWIATDAWRKPAARRRPKLSADDHAQHPAGRVGTPEDIGRLVAWLLGPSSGFVTGQEFVADGGMSRAMIYR